MAEQPRPVQLRENALSWREVEDEILAIDETDWNYFSVGGSGAGLWKLLAAGPVGADELAESLVDRYGIDRETADADVAVFLADLGQRGLLADTSG